MLSMGDVRKGRTVVLDDQPYVVLSADFLRKQQRRPVMRTVLRHLQTGVTREHSWQQSDKIKEAAMERQAYQFLYKEGKQLMFMNQETFEQQALEPAVLGEAASLLLEGQEVTVLLFEGKPVAAELPIKIDRKVITAPPGVKGDTSTNVMKEVVIEGGATIKAPLFIKAGDKIRIDTRNGQYVERA